MKETVNYNIHIHIFQTETMFTRYAKFCSCMKILDIMSKCVSAWNVFKMFFPSYKTLILSFQHLPSIVRPKRNEWSHLTLFILWIPNFRGVLEGVVGADWLLVRAKQSSPPHARTPPQKKRSEEEGEAGNCDRGDRNTSPPLFRTAPKTLCWLNGSF